jgi:hypothetical protein
MKTRANAKKMVKALLGLFTILDVQLFAGQCLPLGISYISVFLKRKSSLYGKAKPRGFCNMGISLF